MPKKVWSNILVLTAMIISSIVPYNTAVKAKDCPDLKIIFARGSGADINASDDYASFRSTIEEKLIKTSLSYEFVDLDYPAIDVGPSNPLAAIGAFFGAGEAYEFGESVDAGVNKLQIIVNDSACKNTKYVLGGYSQGAMVVSKSLGGLNADRLIYAATFGDPKLYLPEGEGIMPAACRNENLSDYRMYVPDCQAYKGLLGAYIPYEPSAFIGKVGTWCNKRDIFCSSHLSISDHVSYVSENLYEDASRVIFDKITKTFGIENNISSPHDTAILIDSTGSMSGMINQYKAEALRLATETLNSGGRVALYDYRDLNDPYTPVERCNFETCNLETFQAGLNNIVVDGGGDTPESLLSASFAVMRNLTWQRGATKSLVILTDSNFLSPDRDGMTYREVIELSRSIDPVNFYIITTSTYASYYGELAADTDGMVFTNFNELNLLTDYIMERYDSLPRVEENTAPNELPELEILETVQTGPNEFTIKFRTNGTQTIVILNDTILGSTEENEIKINNINNNAENVITLVPVKNDSRGSGVSFTMTSSGFGGNNEELVIPKAPNTGKAL